MIILKAIRGYCDLHFAPYSDCIRFWAVQKWRRHLMQIFKTTTISIFHFPSMMNFIWPPKTLLGHCHLMEFLLSAIYHQSKPAEFSGHRPRHVSSWWSYFSLIYCAATIFFSCHYVTILWRPCFDFLHCCALHDSFCGSCSRQHWKWRIQGNHAYGPRCCF